jgi:NAD(P)-dependent dehydrogenase (short-subunit alcohol dehydrogenase family)
MNLRDRVAIVTGAGRRVGRALALALARRGATVAVHYNASEQGAREVVDSITGSGARAEAFGADLTAPDAPAELVARVVQRLGSIDVLVN